MDPLQWMGAVRMRVQTADKNITIIHNTLVHQLTSCEAKSFGYKLYAIASGYKPIINNNTLSNDTINPLLSSNIFV